MTYKVILADPPWRYEVRSDKGKGRSAEAHYDTMPLPAIKALAPQVQALADPTSCALCIWVTDPLLPQALEVIADWGWQYKTVLFTWAKMVKRKTSWPPQQWHYDQVQTTGSGSPFSIGTGYYTRANPEMCLLATRGKRAPKTQDRGVRQLLVAPRGQHSQKPAEARRRIERLFSGPYYELFARSSPGAGWSTAISNQVGLLDNGSIKTRRWDSMMKPITKVEEDAPQTRHDDLQAVPGREAI